LRLSTVAEAHDNLDSQLNYISRLHRSISEQTGKLEQLKQEVDNRFRIYKGFGGFNAHRILHRAAAAQERYEAKVLKAEQEYFAALSAQSRAQERRAQLENHCKEASRALVPLEHAVQEHDRIRDELDQLYEMLFGGPTPGFPYEDEREEAFKAARVRNDETKVRAWKSREVVRLLTLAQDRLPQAQKFLERAQKLAGEILLFSNSARLVNERLLVALAAIRASESYLPLLLPEMLATKKALLLQLENAKLNPDTLHSLDVHSRIASSMRSLSEAAAKLKKLIEAANQAELNALCDVDTTAKELDDARQELQLVREEIFEKVAGFGLAAPAYKCCPPAPESAAILGDGHESEPWALSERHCSLRDANSGLKPPGYLDGEC
jgi:hypothetical protein